jgi:hypothetical protein
MTCSGWRLCVFLGFTGVLAGSTTSVSGAAGWAFVLGIDIPDQQGKGPSLKHALQIAQRRRMADQNPT